MGSFQRPAAVGFDIVNPAISTVVSGIRTPGQLKGTSAVTDCFLLTERDLPERMDRYHPLSASISTEEIIIGFIYMNKRSAFVELVRIKIDLMWKIPSSGYFLFREIFPICTRNKK
jgi:hypothetical protein